MTELPAAPAPLSALSPSIQISKYGAKITRPLTRPEWTSSLVALKDIKQAYQAVLSDVTAYGRREYGDEFVANTLEQLEFDWADAKKATAIATVPIEFRAEHDLDPEKTFILSKLLGEERARWARICHQHKLSALLLKRSIEAGRILSEEDLANESGQGSGFSTIQGVRFQFEKWTRQMGDDSKILAMEKDDRSRILHVLEPIIELASKLQESL